MTQTPHTWASSDNRRIWLYTSVCNFDSPLFMMRGLSVVYMVSYSTAPSYIYTYLSIYPQSPTHTHSIRQSVCFVTIFGSFVRAIKRVSCSFLFKPFNLPFFSLFSLSFFLLGLLFGLKGRVKTKRMFIQWERGRNSMQQHGPSIDFLKLFQSSF